MLNNCPPRNQKLSVYPKLTLILPIVGPSLECNIAVSKHKRALLELLVPNIFFVDTLFCINGFRGGLLSVSVSWSAYTNERPRTGGKGGHSWLLLTLGTACAGGGGRFTVLFFGGGGPHGFRLCVRGHRIDGVYACFAEE